MNKLIFSRINLLCGVSQAFLVTNIQLHCKPFCDKTADNRTLLTGDTFTAFILLRCADTPEGKEAILLFRQDIGWTNTGHTSVHKHSVCGNLPNFVL
jgi:hypothetical protein